MGLNKNLAAKNKKRQLKRAERQALENGGRNRRREDELRNQLNNSPRGEDYEMQGGERGRGAAYQDPD